MLILIFAEQLIVAGASGEDIIAVPAPETVGTGIAADRIVTRTRDNGVVAVQRGYDVGYRTAVQGIVACSSDGRKAHR